MQSEIEKTALNKMIKARSHLLFDNPFIGSQAIKYNLIPTIEYNGKTVRTACIDGKNIAFNPEYVNQLPFNQVKFLLAHEAFHCMLKHHVRRSGRDFETWNKSGDYIINDILINENIGEKIDGICFDEKYNGLNTEKVFKELYQEKQESKKQKQADQNQDNNGGSSQDNSDSDNSDNSQDQSENEQTSDISDDSSQSDGNGQDTKQDDKTDDSGQDIANDPAGSVIDCPSDMDQADIDSDIKESIQSALNYAKKAGKEPGQKVKDLISEILAPSANWKELLKQWIDSTDKTDVSYIRPIDRHNGYYSPGYYSEGLNKIVLAIDVSGSVLSAPNAINAFQSEINELKNVFQMEIDLIYFHSNIERIETYQKHEDIKIEVIETGGTKLMPVIEHIRDNGLNNQIAGLIVFTDLEIFDFPETETGYKTLFVKYGNRQGYHKRERIDTSPIGETIKIDETE